MEAKNHSLSPKPDPETGEPRPPKAPIYGRAPTEQTLSDGSAPRPPKGYSPPLEWYVESNKGHKQAAVVVGILIMVAFFIGAGVSWVGYWWMWLAVVALPLIPYWGLRGTFYAAGADWLRTKRGWVNTYDLILIRLEITTKAVLTLQDSTKRGVGVDITGIQTNRQLWNLVYNGMLHSIHDGTTTEVSTYAQSVLKLPKPAPQ